MYVLISLRFRNLIVSDLVSAGSSGALFGLIGVLYLDLFQNWQILAHPWRNFFILTGIIIFSLGIGLLPFLDNYAHVAGFFTGIVAGIVFVPTISFGKWDGRRKKLLLIIAIPVLIAMFVVGITFFYLNEGADFCDFCKVVNCFPVDSDWCAKKWG